MMQAFCAMALCLGTLFYGSTGDTAPRMNQIQVIGTHNSYHVAPPEYMIEAMRTITTEVDSWRYTHAPLDVQFNRGVRSLELDIHPFLSGFKVMHVPVVDPESTCPEFKDCLSTIVSWSDAHPEHVPISILFEFKMEEAMVAGEPLISDKHDIMMLFEQEICDVVPREKIITPGDVQGDAATLRDAVKNQGWPLLRESLGKLYFVLHNRSELRDAYTKREKFPGEQIMFVNSSPDREDAAFMVVDNPFAPGIPEYLASGMIIRVRADSGLLETDSGDTRKRDTALSGGAQIISTDFPPGRINEKRGYVVTFPGGATVRSNPMTGTDECNKLLASIRP